MERAGLARSVRLAAVLSLVGHAAVARAEDAASVGARAGLGWHVGNGFGPLGVEAFARASPRVALELEVAYARASGETDYGVAPMVRVYLRPDGSSPFAAVGAPLAWKSVETPALERATWFRYGLVANAGYEWRWPSGLGMLAGAGLGWAPEVTVKTASGTVVDERFLGVNFEAGVRYAFF